MKYTTTSTAVVCPYYVDESRNNIRCESAITECKNGMLFETAAQKNHYKCKFCNKHGKSGYEQCPYYKLNTSIYEHAT